MFLVSILSEQPNHHQGRLGTYWAAPGRSEHHPGTLWTWPAPRISSHMRLLGYESSEKKSHYFRGNSYKTVKLILRSVKKEWDSKKEQWLPSDDDHEFVQSLMIPVTEPGKIAGWIAPPKGKINRQPFEFEFVRFH